MAKKNKHDVNKPSTENKGNPSDTGQNKAQIKDIKGKEKVKREDEIADKYLEDEDRAADNVDVKNPNRNRDKPNIDKPSYD